MARRMVRWLVAVLAVVPLVTACGVEVISGRASSQTNGLENRTPAQVEQAAVDALRAAGSVHLTGTVTDVSGQPTRFDVRIQGISFTGTVTYSGAEIAVTVIGETAYFKTDAAGWQALGVPEAAPLMADKWVKTSADTMGRDARFTIDLMANAITQDGVGPRSTVVQTTLNGIKVVVLTLSSGDKLYVANTGEALPLRVSTPGLGDTDFSEHGVDFHITVPPDAVGAPM